MPPAPMFFAATPQDQSIVACLDLSPDAQNVASQAAALARSMNASLTLLHVLEPSDAAAPADPLEWNFRRSRARRFLSQEGASLSIPQDKIALEVAEGDRVQAICDKGDGARTTVVLGVRADDDGSANCNQTAQRVVEAGGKRVVLVPSHIKVPTFGIDRIMVPLDGSSFAETALGEAVRLARSSGAEILLVHIVPEAGLAMFGLPEAVDLNLRRQLDKHNETSAKGFLERTERRLVDQGLKARSLCIRGDPRSTLLELIASEGPDLLVMSTRGQSARHCRDLSVGSTANYLLKHVRKPLMLVRQAIEPTGHALRSEIDLRLPNSNFAR